MSIRSNVDARGFDQRITIQRNAGTEDAPNWQDVITDVWAKVDGAPASSKEPYVRDGIRSVADYTIWVRADIVSRFSVVLTDRVVWRGAYYDIKDMPDQQLRGRLAALIVNRGLNRG